MMTIHVEQQDVSDILYIGDMTGVTIEEGLTAKMPSFSSSHQYTELIVSGDPDEMNKFCEALREYRQQDGFVHA
jgi:hypothetical protein